MTNEEYKQLSIKEFTKATGRYEEIMQVSMKCVKKIIPIF